MERLLSQLYHGQYCAESMKTPTDKQYQEALGKALAINQKIVDELKKNGVEDPETLSDEWKNAWFNFTTEELIQCFKKGIKFGLQLREELDEL